MVNEEFTLFQAHETIKWMFAKQIEGCKFIYLFLNILLEIPMSRIKG